MTADCPAGRANKPGICGDSPAGAQAHTCKLAKKLMVYLDHALFQEPALER